MGACCFAMKILFLFYFITVHFSRVQSAHFSGGSVTWKPLNTTGTIGSTINVMFTQSYQWKRSAAGSFCNDTYIVDRSPLVPSGSGSLECVTGTTSQCGGYTTISTRAFCIDYSIPMDSSSTQISTIKNLTVGSKFCVAFQGSAWVKLNVECPTAANPSSSTTATPVCYNTGARWSIGTCVDLSIRPDGFINSPPVATVMSPIKAQVNTLATIKIPLLDANGDYLRCRWAQNTSALDECADACGQIVGTTLDATTCTIEFNATGKKVGDYFPVNLIAEDFYSQSNTIALSSVPIQFLIQIIKTPTCLSKPVIESNLSDCTAIEVGIPFNFTVTIKQGCSGTTIIDYFRTPPLNMYKSGLTQVGSSNIWTITEMWTPESTQVGSQAYCAQATDNASIVSDLYCTAFNVAPAGEAISCLTYPVETTTTTATSSTSTTSTTATISTENPKQNDLIRALILGLVIPLILLSMIFLIYRCYFKKTRSIHHEGKVDEIQPFSNNNQLISSNSNNPFDYRHQYINTRKSINKGFNSTSSSDMQVFALDDRIESSILSDFESNYGNQTKTSLFSHSACKLPTEDVQYTRNVSSPLEQESILMHMFSHQQYQRGFSRP